MEGKKNYKVVGENLGEKKKEKKSPTTRLKNKIQGGGSQCKKEYRGQ